MLRHLKSNLSGTKCHDAMLATLEQVNFCYVLRFIIISSVHAVFSYSIIVHTQNIVTQKNLLRKSSECFDTGIVKKMSNFQYWNNKTFLYLKYVNVPIILAPLSSQNSLQLKK